MKIDIKKLSLTLAFAITMFVLILPLLIPGALVAPLSGPSGIIPWLDLIMHTIVGWYLIGAAVGIALTLTFTLFLTSFRARTSVNPASIVSSPRRTQSPRRGQKRKKRRK